MQVQHSIDVQYQSTNDPETAKEWLNSLPKVFSADFETAVRYPKEVIEDAKTKMIDTTLPKKERVVHQAIANASALGHPSHCTITHCSIAYSEKDAYVFIIDAQPIADVVLDFLVHTDRTQVWHNYAYDGRFIRYYAGQDAKNVEDTQIFAKTLVNHVEVFKARSGLKDLAGHWYGDWGISADNFTIAQQYDKHVIKYAAIDACATFKLWEYLNGFVNRD
jgi:hypothetical protein